MTRFALGAHPAVFTSLTRLSRHAPPSGARAIRGLGRAFVALAPIDWRSVARDSLLRWMIAIAIPVGFLTRWGVPALARSLEQRYGFDLTPYYPLVMSFNLLLMPILAGIVVGFMLLDERDDATLSAIQVTPLGLAGYLGYRATMPMLLSVVLTVVVLEISALTPVSSVTLWWMSLAVAPLAPVFALFLGTFAANKVQGLALTKANGVLTLPPVAAWFIDGPWQFAVGVVPTYWPAKAFWQAARGDPLDWLFALVGSLFQIALLGLLMRRFLRIMRRG